MAETPPPGEFDVRSPRDLRRRLRLMDEAVAMFELLERLVEADDDSRGRDPNPSALADVAGRVAVSARAIIARVRGGVGGGTDG